MMKNKDSINNNQLNEAFKQINALLFDGIQHGFFEYTISSEIVNDKKRKLMIKAGKSYKFTIPADDICN